MLTRMAPPVYLAAAFGTAFFRLVAPANAQVAPVNPPVQTADNAPVSSVRVGAYLRLPVTYTLLRGTEFDGRHVSALDGNRTVYLPKVSGGFGFNPSLGVKLAHLAPHFGVMAGLGFGFSKHQAISYNVGNSWYEHSDATFYQLDLELRALAEFGNFKPFVGISPGYAMLSLPKGITVLDANRNVSWSDITLRGASMGVSLGLLYELAAPVSLDASMGYRIQHLTSSGAGSLSGFGFSPGWSATLGVVLSMP